MTSDTFRIVGKLWSYCNLLRDDGLSYGDDLERISERRSLQKAEEQTKAPWIRPSPVPAGWDQASLLNLEGARRRGSAP